MTLPAMGFGHPELLILLLLCALPLSGLSAPASLYPSVDALPEDSLSLWVVRSLRLVASLAIASAVIGLAAPYRDERRVERFVPGAEIVVLLDRSQSMDQSFAGGRNAGWWAGGAQNKATVARQLLANFAARRSHDRIGMIEFSTLPIRIIDLTQHRDLIQAAIRASALGRGLAETDMGRGLLDALSFFADRPYTGSRVILLVSDGGAELDSDTRDRISRLMKHDHVALYWLYLRSFRSPGLDAKAGASSDGGDVSPERQLHLFFRSMGAPYRVYEAENPHALEEAIDDVGRLENLPMRYTEVLPRVDRSRVAYAAALVFALVLLGAKALEVDRWS